MTALVATTPWHFRFRVVKAGIRAHKLCRCGKCRTGRGGSPSQA